MVVLLMMAIILAFTIARLQEQAAARQLEVISRKWVTHANFARNQALYLGEPVQMLPRNNQDWNGGWVITSGCIAKQLKEDCKARNWFSQEDIYPLYFKNRGFVDPHAHGVQIQFNATGAAKTGQGGFLANRLIIGHRHYADLERQLILGSGGRWRICNPKTDHKGCK